MTSDPITRLPWTTPQVKFGTGWRRGTEEPDDPPETTTATTTAPTTVPETTTTAPGTSTTEPTETTPSIPDDDGDSDGDEIPLPGEGEPDEIGEDEGYCYDEDADEWYLPEFEEECDDLLEIGPNRYA